MLDGERFNDDRMFVAHIGRCVVVQRARTIDTTIFHEAPPPDALWCLLPYRNTPGYPAYRIDHFETEEEAQRYLEQVLPDVPLVSAGGVSPRPRRTYEEYRDWERQNGLLPFDPLRMFSPGGHDAREIVVQPRRTRAPRDGAA